ncbi:hypothetical protein Tco_1402150 [Tanacetum coccineum]
MEVVYRQLILMLNPLYSTSRMVVLSNIRAYSDYDFFNGHQMQLGGRKGKDVIDFLHVPLNGYSSEQKQFSLMWLASSAASSTSLILLLLLLLLL